MTHEVSDGYDYGFGKGPRPLLRDPSISRGAKILYVVLDDHTNGNGTTAFPSIETLAEYLGVCRSTVKLELSELAKAGWLTKKTRKGTSNLYVLGDGRGVSPLTGSERGGGQPADWGGGQPADHEAEPLEAEPKQQPSRPEPKVRARVSGEAHKITNYFVDQSAKYLDRPPKKISKADLAEADRLLRLGPPGLERPHPVPVDQVLTMIRQLFAGEIGNDWQRQNLQSMSNFRKHWDRLAASKPKTKNPHGWSDEEYRDRQIKGLV